MPFKIVHTIEKGRPQLCVVPNLWEYKGLLRYPKKISENKLARIENSKPQSDWRCMACTVKRDSLSTYEEAEFELAVMLNNSDTDVAEEREKVHQSQENQIDFNAIADCLVINQQHGPSPNDAVQEEYANVEFIDSGDQDQNNIQIQNNIEQTLLHISNSQQLQNHQIEQLLGNQQKIIDSLNTVSANQKKVINRVASLSVQIDELYKKSTNDKVVTLNEAQDFEKENFRIDPIDNITMLEEFETTLSDNTTRSKLMKKYSIFCSSSPGNGGTCAYKMLDLLFTREFMCSCSWSGGSRGEAIKIGLKGYKNILTFFFELVHYWDPSYTLDDNTSFFKTILKNANSRKNTMNARTSTKRKHTERTSHIKKTKNENTNNDKDHQVSSQVDSEQNKDSANLPRVEIDLEIVSEITANLASGKNVNANE